MPEPLQDPLSFGELKTLLGQMIGRGGRDSAMADSLRGHLINAAEQYVNEELSSSAYWLEATGTLTIPANTSVVTADQNVRDIVNIRDEGNVRALQYMDREAWNKYITDATDVTGPPLAWTKHGYSRRDNTETPDEPYGQLQVAIWPVPTGETVVQTDVMLRAGHMVDDSDLPILPISMHWGLLQVACWFAGPYDVGNKAFAQHERLAGVWMATMRRGAVRNMAGSPRLVPGEEHRRGAAVSLTPPTRAAQLIGR